MRCTWPNSMDRRDRSSRAQHIGVHHRRRQGEERSGPPGRSESRRALGHRQCARSASGARLRSVSGGEEIGGRKSAPGTERPSTYGHEHYRVAKRSCSRRGQVEGTNRSRGGRWVSQSAGSRSEAHVRPATSRGWRVIRRSTGPARPQEQSDHDALLRSRTHESDSCGGEGLRWGVPQFPRNHLVTATSGRSEPRQDIVAVREIGAPGEIRTPDHLVRSQVLYPAELRARGSSKGGDPTTTRFMV